MKKILFVVLLIGIIYAGFQMFGGKHDAAAMPGMGGPVPVSAAKVLMRNVNEWDEFSGRIEAVERVEIRPRVAGTIEEVHFKEGQMVKKGDLLFTIDPKPYQAAYQAAAATAAFNKTEYDRAGKLLPEKAISKREFDEKKSAFLNAEASLTKAQLDLGYCRITAPVSGRASRAELTVGNLVNVGNTMALTTIVSLDPIYASFEVDEQSYVRYLHANNENPNQLANIPIQVALSGDSDFKYQGQVKSFDNELNTRSGTVRVRASLPNKSGALIPGLYARIRVSGAGKSNLILASEKAIVTDQDRKLVFVVNAENKIEPRPVKLGGVVDGLRVIHEGLKEGETIVVGGIQRVRPGAEVKAEIVAMDASEEKKQ